MTDRKIIGIQKVTVNAADEENVLDVEILPMSGDSEDLVEIQFTPNTVKGVGDKQWDKWWLIKVVHDGWTDVWDDYINYDGEGAVIPSFSVTFELTGGDTEVWTAEASKCYIRNGPELKAEIEQEHQPGPVEIILIGDFTITHP